MHEVRLALDQNDDEEYGLWDLLDPTINNMTYMTGFKRFIQLALRCVEDSASDHPTMSDVVKALDTPKKHFNQ